VVTREIAWEIARFHIRTAQRGSQLQTKPMTA
jgi:hypothetical protein